MGVNSCNSQYPNINNPELQKRMESQENFTALDKEQLKQDAVELSTKAKENAQDGWFYSTFHDFFNVENPQKTLIPAIFMTIAAVFGFGVLTNKLSPKIANLAEPIDKFLLEGENFISKGYRAIAKGFSSIKDFVSDKILRSKLLQNTTEDLSVTFKNRKAKQKWNFFRGYDKGAPGIFRLTPVDNVKKALQGLFKIEKKEAFETICKAQDTESLKKLARNANMSETEICEALKGLAASKRSFLSRFFKQSISKEAYEQIIKLDNYDDIIEVFSKNEKDIDSVNEVLRGQLIKNLDKSVQKEHISKILNNDAAENVVGLLHKEGTDDSEICEAFRKGIAEKFNCFDKNGEIDVHKLNNIFEQMRNGKIDEIDVSEFTDIVMMDKDLKGLSRVAGLVADWWPVRVIDKAGEFITRPFRGTKPWKGFGRGNFGDAMQKYCMAQGKLAKTAPARFIQSAATITSDSFHNFHNDKSGLGVFLGLTSIAPFFANLQITPKEKKVSTTTNYVFGNALHWAFAMPISFGITYGLATLRNLEGKTLLTKLLKPLGKFFGMGLDTIKNGELIKNNCKTTGVLGGVLRFILIAAVFSPKIGSILEKITQKILGKPYDVSEERRKKEQEEQENAIIPELGISQKQLMEKIQNNPDKVQALQTDTQLAQKIAQNPKLLVDYLDGKDINNTNVQTQKPVNIDTNNKPWDIQLNSKPNAVSQNNAMENNKVLNNQPQEQVQNHDTATYIPSSDFSANDSNITDEQTERINQVMNRADSALKRAEELF